MRRITTTATAAAGLLAATATAAGDLEFIDSGQRLGGFISTEVALGDFDGDGDLDAFTPTYVGPSLVWLNRGDETFIDSGQRIGGSLSGKALAADLDGDSDVDIFLVSHSFDTTILLNNGDATFVEWQTLGSANMHAADLGDIDRDGDLDAFVGSIAGHINAPALNNGNGVFVFGANAPLPEARAVALGDIDGDDDLDVLLGIGDSGSDQSDRVFRNDGGEFVDGGQRLGNAFTSDVALGDLDDDGDLDAFIGNGVGFGGNPADKVLINDGSGSFADSGQSLDLGDAMDVDLADFDADGDLDCFVANTTQPDRLWINDGSGGFTLAEEFNTDNAGSTRADFGDLDGDGDLDLYIAMGGSGDRVFLNISARVAVLQSVSILTGSIVSGDLADLRDSDDARLRTRSGFGGTFIELHNMTMTVSANAGASDPATLDVTIESRVSQPSGTARVSLRNWDQNRFDTIGSYPIGQTEESRTFADIAAASFVRDDGGLELAIRHIVVVPVFAFRFDSFIDLVRIVVRR